MALGTAKDAICRPDAHASRTYPVGLQTDWVQISDTMEDFDGASANGDVILLPLTGAILRTTLYRLKVNGRGTTLLLCVKYDDTAITVSPIVQPFGFDKNDIPHKLKNAAGTHELTLTCVVATDLYDGTTYRYSDPVEVDLDGSSQVLVGTKTMLAGTGGAPANFLLAKTL